MDPILDNLNPEQRRAVLQKDGAMLIIAGAGSGKTRVLTSKIALLMREGVHPANILALTFTKKAANEMRTRIATMVGPAAKQLVMGTFHSVFVRFLREYHQTIGFPAAFTIYDAEDAQSCLKDCIGEVLFGPNHNNKEYLKTLSAEEKKQRKHTEAVYKVKDVASRISGLKNSYILPKDYKELGVQQNYDLKKGRPKLGEIYELYMKRCRGAGAMDFDDILVYMLFLLERHPYAKQDIAQRFQYILVDEYQDTNAVQYDIVRHICYYWKNICAVGDDSQSIYAFRGARIQNILNYRNDFPDCKEFKLESNYRSTSQIVDAANRLIENNETRLPKVCHAIKGTGKPIEVEYLKNDREEARYIANTIASRKAKGQGYSSFAVLYRTNAQARALEDEFIKKHIPYAIYSGMSFFERMEVKDTVAYMRLTVNPSDNEAFKRICNKPARGISEATLNALMVKAAEKETSLTEVASDPAAYCPELKPKAAEACIAFTKMMDILRKRTADMDAYDAASAILSDTGIYNLYKDDEGEDGLKRAHNIDELLNSISYFIDDRMESYQEGDGEKPDTSLSSYLENIALLSKADQQDDNQERVSLMTSHCSKGLEFNTVFIAGVEEGLYPALRSDSSDFDLQEERRLFYVSITRAKDELILTSCDQRWRYREMEECTPSRFIDEMFSEEEPEDLPE